MPDVFWNKPSSSSTHHCCCLTIQHRLFGECSFLMNLPCSLSTCQMNNREHRQGPCQGQRDSLWSFPRENCTILLHFLHVNIPQDCIHNLKTGDCDVIQSLMPVQIPIQNFSICAWTLQGINSSSKPQRGALLHIPLLQTEVSVGSGQVSRAPKSRKYTFGIFASKLDVYSKQTPPEHPSREPFAVALKYLGFDTHYPPDGA